MKKIVIQGVKGCYHDIAAGEYFKENQIEIVESQSFDEMFDILSKNDDYYAIMAIENTIAGNLLKNHELLRKSDMHIIGEHRLHISHSLCTLPGQKLEDLKEVHSHPIALMQCEDFLKGANHLKVVEKEDTAQSAKHISERGKKGRAAICSAHAAKLYGLEVIASGIETNTRNFTRFLVLSKKEEPQSVKINKSSLVFSVAHTQGSLSKVLATLSFYDINLSKIQSMPIIGEEWEYRFYIDLTFDDYDQYRKSLNAIIPFTNDFKILGEYEESK